MSPCLLLVAAVAVPLLNQLPWYWYGFDHFGFAVLMVLLAPGLLALVFGWLAFRSRVTGVYLSIMAQALTYDDYVTPDGEQGADVVHLRFNAPCRARPGPARRYLHPPIRSPQFQ